MAKIVNSWIHLLLSRHFVITGSIACSATCRFLSHSEADFEVFRPERATGCTDGGEIWHAKFYLNKIKSAATRKCPYYHYVTNKVIHNNKHFSELAPHNGGKQLA